MRHPPTKDDLDMISFLIENEFPFIIILTKKDKLTKTKQQERLAALKNEIPCFDQITVIPFSAEVGDGVSEILEIIEDIGEESGDEDDKL